jgi:nucleotide-binding universal stress UspA family protein
LLLDGSEKSFKTANYAIYLSYLTKADQVILHDIKDIKQAGVIGFRARYGDLKLVKGFVNVRKKATREWMVTIENFANKKGVKIKTILEEDSTSIDEVIIKFTEEHKIDLLIMGSKDYSKFKKLLVGSLATILVSHSKCLILVVR